MLNYVGITVGPIFSTIMEASSPAALWFASTMFSDITRRLCIGIEKEFDDLTLFTPYIEPADKGAIGIPDGVGKYHDRIIFSTEKTQNDVEDKLNKIINAVKSDTINIFPDAVRAKGTDKKETFLNEYLQIHFVMITEEEKGSQNVILAVSPYLDAIENMMTFPCTNAHNPINMTMNGKMNQLVKKSALFTSIDEVNNHLLKNKKGVQSIWGIEDIASGNIYRAAMNDYYTAVDLKYEDYYAVVSADADGMGSFFEKLTDNETLKFSEKCVQYSKSAAKSIREYGGMTIYAGGDDLLFLAPVKTKGGTIFDLCHAISDTFMKGEKNKPTVSFGVFISYKKYPLYEALENATNLLRKKAKNFKVNGIKKNCIAVNLEKHSGQSTSLYIGNEWKTVWDDFMKAIQASQDTVIKSLGSSIEKNYALLKVIGDQYPDISTSWDDIYDNAGQLHAKAFIDQINQLFYGHFFDNSFRMKIIDEIDNDRDEKLDTLQAILRIGKFFVEQKGDK